MFPCFFFAWLSSRFLTHSWNFPSNDPQFFFFWQFERKASVFPETDFSLPRIHFALLTRIRRPPEKSIFNVWKFKRVEEYDENLQSCEINLHVPKIIVTLDWSFSCKQILNSLICLDHLIYFCQLLWLCRFFNTFINASESCVRE